MKYKNIFFDTSSVDVTIYEHGLVVFEYDDYGGNTDVIELEISDLKQIIKEYECE